MARHKILIIEDEPDLAKVLSNRLASRDFEVSIAQDAYQGSSQVINKQPDLVILDLMLPAGGGIKVLKNIRINSKIMNMPVMILTGLNDPEYEKQIRALGVQAYFQKPYEFETLLGKIKELLMVE